LSLWLAFPYNITKLGYRSFWKKVGNFHVDNLQAVFLMEGDFNAAMKIFIGACMIANALTLKLIPAKCYGSQPGCTAIQVLLNCTLTTDIT